MRLGLTALGVEHRAGHFAQQIESADRQAVGLGFSVMTGEASPNNLQRWQTLSLHILNRNLGGELFADF
jgi:hypothetical protein